MNKKNPFHVNEGARRMIFFGAVAFPMSILMCIGTPLQHFVGEKALPYVLWGIMAILAVLGMLAYNVTPKRLVLPFGIIGWLIAASILCWYGWFGPGAFGHTHQQW